MISSIIGMDVGLLVILEFELFDNNKKNWFGFKAT
jgi:hypothetical protein